jgi:hypothetical protein
MQVSDAPFNLDLGSSSAESTVANNVPMVADNEAAANATSSPVLREKPSDDGQVVRTIRGFKVRRLLELYSRAAKLT